MATPTTTSIFGKILPNTSKSIVKSKVDKLSGFKYPIEENPYRGYFSKQSGKDLIKSNLRFLLRTSRGERFMLPNYGCNLRKFLMEPLDDTTFNSIRREILESISKYLKKVSVTKLQIFENKPSFSFTNVLNIKLFCSIKDEEDNNLDISIKV